MFRTCEAKILLTGLFVFSSTSLSALPSMATNLAPHRAVYNLTLDTAEESAGIDGMYGRMVYEFNGSDCAGYSSLFRFVTAIETNGVQRLNDQRTETYEDLRKGFFRFETQSYSDDVLNNEVRGKAIHANGSVDVTLDTPVKRNVSLQAGSFPTEHIRDVLELASKGQHFFETRIYDGSEEGDKTLIASTSIGGEGKASAGDGEQSSSLVGKRFWPVSIAYFNDEAVKDDDMPIYNMSFKLYENGISRELTLDYGDFVLSGHLAELQMLDQPDCR